MFRALALVSLLAMVAPAQQTLVVGSGEQYTEISQAVILANPGDIILVRAGTYRNFTVDKPLRILADPGVSILGFSSSTTFRVRNVPAGLPVVIRGITLQGAPLVPVSIYVQDCAAPVHLENISMNGGFQFVQVFNNAQVSFHECTLGGEVAIHSSTVLVTESSIKGNNATFVLPGQPAVDIQSSRVVIAGGTFTGGDSFFVPIQPPGPALLLQSGRLVVTGDPSTVLAAGESMYGGVVPVPAIDSVTGELIVDPAPTLAPLGGAAAIIGGATVTQTVVPALTVDVVGRTMTTAVRGTEGDAVFVIASPMALPLPLPTMDLWLGFSHVVLAGGTIPAQGVFSHEINLPALFPGTSAPVQAVLVSGFRFALSNPVVTRWD